MNCLSLCQLTCLWWLFGTSHSRCDTSWCIFAETMKTLLFLMFRQSSFFFKYSKKNSRAPLLLGLEGSRGPDCPLCAFPRLRCNEDNLNKQCDIRTKDVTFLSFSFVMNRLDNPLDKAEQLRLIDCVLNRNWIWYSRCCKMQKRCTSVPFNAQLIL